MKFIQRPLVAAIAAALPLFAHAASDAPQTLETVQVWGTRVETSSVQLGESDMAIRQADHISDLLRVIPGVDVGGAHSLNQRITIRNMDDKDLRISIDGANQNTYMYHHMGNLQIHADILQSVAIDVGNNSVINGGLGGAVRFETKTARQLLRPQQQFGGRVQGSWADNAGSGYSATGYGQLTEQLDALAYFNAVERGNFDVGGGKIKDFDGNEITGTDGSVRGLEGDVQDTLIKFGWDLTSTQRLEFGYEAYKDEGNYSYRPDMGLATGLAIANSLGIPLLYPTEFTRDTYTLNYDLQWGAASSLKAALFRNESTFWRDERGLAGWRPAFATINEGDATNTGFNVLATSQLESTLPQTLTYGLDLINYETAYSVSSVTLADEEARNYAVFIEDGIALTDTLTLRPGLRYDHYTIDAAVVDDSFSKATGALAVEFHATNNLLLRASSTQLFKAPELAEVYIGAGLYDTANPDIEAETGYNHELSAGYQAALFGADRFSAGLTLFRTDIHDYIYDYASTATFDGKDNIGDMRIDGFEAYIGYGLGNLNALLTYSVAESELDAFADYADLDGARIDREQGDSVSLVIDYALPSLGLTLQWDSLYVGSVSKGLDLDGATAHNAKDSYNVHSISASWSPAQAKGLTITLGIDNLFDEYYASQSSRTGLSLHPRFGELYLLDYEPGRNLKTTVAYQF